MRRVFQKDQILTIPNLLSLIRLLLIPLIVWLYCDAKRYHAVVLVVALSALTDIADGFIARRFHMVSDFGKILDPIADKLTQIALILCLISRYRLLIALLVEFALRELIMLILGYVTIKEKDSVNSSKWHGKLSTVLLYCVMTALILFPEISYRSANTMIIACGVIMALSFIQYVRFYKKLLSSR